MPFSDDDLKRLKEDLEKHIVIDLIQDFGLSLLARLEAAENCIEQFDYDEDCQCSPTDRFCRHQQAYAVWLSKAGK